VLVTFDDAYADLRDAALPLLTERGIPALVFAVGGLLGASNEWDRPLGARPRELLDAGGLAELAAAGIEVGAHSVSHARLPRLTDEELAREVSGAADRLDAAGLPRPRAFSYPYGEHDARVRKAVGDAGYAVAFTVQPGMAGPRDDRLALPRVEVLASDRAGRFRLRTVAARWPRPVRHAVYRVLRATRGRGGRRRSESPG
jgi:peptidoglycan/xylan/chitin deacetylase (PgdA/CDA1 family)